MKGLIILAAFTLLYSLTAFSQNTLKTKPVIYGEAGFGFPLTGSGGFQGNFALNYQENKSLFTVRFTGIDYFQFSTVELSPFTVFPGIKNNGSLTEYGFLYGLRFVNGGQAFSFSAGASLNDRIVSYTDINHQNQHIESYYPGLPFEINVLWFKASKRKYHIYGMIPVGRPTAFGNSFGFKLSGNVSQHSYLSLGMVFGLGYHKQY